MMETPQILPQDLNPRSENPILSPPMQIPVFQGDPTNPLNAAISPTSINMDGLTRNSSRPPSYILRVSNQPGRFHHHHEVNFRMMERQRQYYTQYYLRLRPQTSGDVVPNNVQSSSTNVEIGNSNSNIVPPSSSFNAAPPLVFTGEAYRREVPIVGPEPSNSGRVASPPNQNTSSNSSDAPAPRRLIHMDEFEFLRDVLQGTILTIRESINNNGTENLLNIASTYRNGLTKHEINRNTISYEYKPKKRKRMKSASNGTNIQDTENDNCSICLDRFCTHINVRRLPCLHVFHLKCIDKWLRQNKKCPICRISITINYENLISSLKSGSSIEQCVSQQEAPRPSITHLIQELQEIQRSVASRRDGNTSFQTTYVERTDNGNDGIQPSTTDDTDSSSDEIIETITSVEIWPTGIQQ